MARIIEYLNTNIRRTKRTQPILKEEIKLNISTKVLPMVKILVIDTREYSMLKTIHSICSILGDNWILKNKDHSLVEVRNDFWLLKNAIVLIPYPPFLMVPITTTVDSPPLHTIWQLAANAIKSRMKEAPGTNTFTCTTITITANEGNDFWILIWKFLFQLSW